MTLVNRPHPQSYLSAFSIGSLSLNFPPGRARPRSHHRIDLKLAPNAVPGSVLGKVTFTVVERMLCEPRQAAVCESIGDVDKGERTGEPLRAGHRPLVSRLTMPM